jgi:glutamyl-tRNA synthetase/glutamyl-Q tRNA(Asp) synthetase
MLRASLVAPPLTRFAPSPTGHLHLGHVVNAIYTWGLAAALDGRVILRIEDHDRIRSRPAFEAALLEDLDWLGFVPDRGRHPVHRQSDDHAVYAAALERLRRHAHVYACACSRKEIGSDVYPGTCRERQLVEGPGMGLRVQMSGPHGDLLLRDRDGHWTYQFAVVVDDLRQGVTLVVRGADLESSTGRQIELARLLGRTAPPVFVHHPLLLNPQGEKLSKSAGDTGVRELRAAGVAAAAVIGQAAAAVGLIPEPMPVHASRVRDLFG